MGERIARVVVDLALDKEFDYRVPEGMAVQVGCRVRVPFGKRRVMGYVVGMGMGMGMGKGEGEKRWRLKDVEGVVGEKSYLPEGVLKLARWMAEYYCAPVEKAIRTVLPRAVRKEGARKKERLWVAPAAQLAGGSGQGAGGSGRGVTEKQGLVMGYLGEKGAFLADVVREVGVTAGVVKTLQKKGLVTVEPATVQRDVVGRNTVLRTQPLTLMPEQAAALRIIEECQIGNRQSAIGNPRPGVVLLHGVTGSGKTEVYLQAIDGVLKRGQGAIVLVPEISLTPQTVERFVGRFGARVAVLHSHLSDGERHDEWHRVRDGKASIVVGARSAVFAPLEKLGLIVVDEEHEPSYKQEDAPRYSARDVAVMRGHMEGCPVVLGSATPCLESWANAQRGKYRLARLTKRADDRKMPVMRVIDMRVEAQRSGHVSVFSRDLLEAMRLRLDRAEQTILFLNRRGFATSLVCPLCGFVASCDNCSVSYTYHRKDERLRCHICGASRVVPDACPGCADKSFKFTGVGTQRVESTVRKCFPQARIERMDADATRTKDSYERILGGFRVGKTDILIGTQMIAKGLHFPNVTLVGVVYADLSLHMPDFRAGERTFQLLAQVAGRAGRGDVSGEVIVQTYTPFHVAVQAARRLDYEGFCDQEIEFRRELSYPPATHLTCLTFRGPSEEKVSFTAAAFSRALKEACPPAVLVPNASPAPIARAKGNYRYQLMLRSVSVKAMNTAVRQVVETVKLPAKVTCTVDVDAVSLL